ncbi:hypothetical protein PanWU01x14_279670 [Parasponia andersonii]|uniref:Uncharacterized protein n=1 Tax=Parasponia andersonii TaxID=3476 RepID=A0A2P5B1T2_PARAD|nr:hypothetical protein PanWU01x14_279670 [Parasponia andersonii]
MASHFGFYGFWAVHLENTSQMSTKFKVTTIMRFCVIDHNGLDELLEACKIDIPGICKLQWHSTAERW